MPHWSSSISRRRLVTGALAAACATALVTPPTVMADHTPSPVTQDEAEYVRSQLARMSLEEKVGQLFVTHVYGSGATEVTPAEAASNQASYGVDTPAGVVEKYHLGGVIYFNWSGNYVNPEQVAELSNGLQETAAADGIAPLIIATDQESGVVVRLGPPATQFPGVQALAAGGSTRDARQAAKITARELRAVGINQNFAPVADVNVNAENPVIGVRSFSSDPGIVSDFVRAQVSGFQHGQGVAAAAKHFPGHGDTDEDSHTGLPEIEHTRSEWERLDRPPFDAAIAEDVDVIMTAHIVVRSLDDSGDPATLSEPIITGLLRDEMGYDGVVITDALTMAGVREHYGPERAGVLALKAGVDQLLMPATGEMDIMYESVLGAVRNGEIAEERIDQSVERVLGMKWRRGIVDHPYVDASKVDKRVGHEAHLKAAQQITDPTITALRNTDADGDAILPVEADGSVFIAAANSAAGNALADSLRSRGAEVDVLNTGTRPSDASIATAVDAAATHDLTVVVTSKAWDTAITDPAGRQQRLVSEVTATGNPTLAVASRDAYDVAYLPDEAAFLAAYSTTTVSMESVAKVVTGEMAPEGRLPVDVPGADGSTLYPVGAGLTWPATTRP